MSCILDLVLNKVVNPIVDVVVQKVVRHVGYIVWYKRNMKELEDEKEKLGTKLSENEEKVGQANIRNDVVEEKVVEWTKTAEKMKREVEDLVVAEARDENYKFLKLSLPNLRSRYRMSKQAEKKKVALEGHIRDGDFAIVAHHRPPPQELQFTLSTGNFMDFDSRRPLLNKIKDGLANPGVTMVGVYGAGGVGKTTAVEEVAKQLKKDGVFYEVVKGVVSQDVNIREIQGHLAEKLSLKLEKETEEERAGELWNRLNNGKDNLVILDDLWRELDLRAIGIPLKDGNKGCKVILTTRDRDVLRKMKVDEYIPVVILNEDESWNLFKKKVGINFASDELLSLAKLVCKECEGLPVAILAVGGALAGKNNERNWRDALNKLKNSFWEKVIGIDKKMYASLRLSYDYLEQEEKSILLSCSLYPEDAEIPVDFLLFHCIARRLLGPINDTVEEARDQIFTLVDSLKSRSLLLDGKDGESVKMHDVVRDVVLSIAKNEKQYLFKNVINEWPNESINENLAAVSVSCNKLKEVPDVLVCPRLHTLRIECTDHRSFSLPDNFFSGVRKLRILELKAIDMSSTLSSLSNLSELRTLILNACQLRGLPFLKVLTKSLEVLVIENSSIGDIPTELGEQSHLRVLIMNRSSDLRVIPAGVISKLTHLEELQFPDEFDIRGHKYFRNVVDPSRATLLELNSLTRLTSLSVFIPRDRPVPDICYHNLVSYRLAVGSPFFTRGEYGRELLSGRKILQLHYTAYNEVFDTLLERAEKLYMCRVEGLKKGILENNSEVEFLYMEYCDGLDSLSGSANTYNQGLMYPPSPFSKLTILNINFGTFKFLFTASCAAGLQQLRELDIWNCQMLEEIIIGTQLGDKDELDQDNNHTLVHFRKLEVLTVGQLPKLKSFGPRVDNTTADGQPFFSEKVIFPALKHLDIRNVENITEIWSKKLDPTKSFPRLSKVEISHCNKLVNVFPSCSWAQNLQVIDCHGCKGAQVVFSISEEERDGANIIFPQLHNLSLSCLDKIESFCGHSNRSEPPLYLFDPQIQFPALEYLTLKYLPPVIETFRKQVLAREVTFPALKELVYNLSKWYIDGKPNMEYLEQELTSFP